MCPEGSCSLWRAHAGAGSWRDLQPMERLPHRSRFSLIGTVAHGKLTLEQSIPEELGSMERTYAGAVLEENYLMRRTHMGAGEK